MKFFSVQNFSWVPKKFFFSYLHERSGIGWIERKTKFSIFAIFIFRVMVIFVPNMTDQKWREREGLHILSWKNSKNSKLRWHNYNSNFYEGEINFFSIKNFLKYPRLLKKITAVAVTVVVLTTTSQLRLSKNLCGCIAVTVIRSITNVYIYKENFQNKYTHSFTKF